MAMTGINGQEPTWQPPPQGGLDGKKILGTAAAVAGFVAMPFAADKLMNVGIKSQVRKEHIENGGPYEGGYDADKNRMWREQNEPSPEDARIIDEISRSRG